MTKDITNEPFKQHPEYYNGFLTMLQYLSFDKGQAGVEFTQTNFETLKDLVQDYRDSEAHRAQLSEINKEQEKEIHRLLRR